MSDQPDVTVVVAGGHPPGETPAPAGERPVSPPSGPPPGPPPPGAPASRAPWVVAAVASAVAVLAIVAAVVLASWWAPLHNEARDRRAVQALATEFVLHLTTFEGEHIEQWVEETQEWATGTYARELERLFDPELQDALRDLEARSEGEVLNLFVQDVTGDEATVFAVVLQVVDNRVAQPTEDELRMEVTMQRDGGSWLVSRVAVLGPGGLPAVEEVP